MRKFLSFLFVAVGLSVMLMSAPARAEDPCDCRKELQRLENTRTDVERLEADIVRTDAKIEAAQRDAEAQYKTGDAAQRQLEGTLDLMKRAAAKGTVDTSQPELQRALKETKDALKQARDEGKRRREKTDALRKEKDAQEQKLAAARDAAAKALEAYRACKARCTGEKQDDGKPIVIIMELPGSNPLDLNELMIPRCPACETAEEKLKKAQDAYAAAQSDLEAARTQLEQAHADLKAASVVEASAEDDFDRALDEISAVVKDFQRLGAKLDDIRELPDVKQRNVIFQDILKKRTDANVKRAAAEDAVGPAEKRVGKAAHALTKANADLIIAADEMEKCNRTCKPQEGQTVQPLFSETQTVCAYTFSKDAANSRKASDALALELRKRVAAEGVVAEKYRKLRHDLDGRHYHIGGGMSEADFQAELAKLKSQEQQEVAPLHQASLHARECLGDYIKALAEAAKAAHHGGK